jgi:hypothetical protein
MHYLIYDVTLIALYSQNKLLYVWNNCKSYTSQRNIEGKFFLQNHEKKYKICVFFS